MSGETLGDIGEVAALARIIPRLPRARDSVLGPGDDAAVLATSDGRVVLTTDQMVEGPDFRRAWSSPHDLGVKIVASNLADIAAMGARATGLLVTLAAPADTRIGDLEELADGIADACGSLAPGCGALGGDLTLSPQFSVAVTAVGSLDGRSPVLRSGARPGDVVAYAGRLGLASAALALLFRDAVDADGVPSPQRAAALRNRVGALLDEQLAPHPPIEAGPAAARAGATAMLDVSDGLVLDAGRIARASGVTLDLHASALAPHLHAVREAAGLSVDAALRAVLTGGEDHGLLACFAADARLPSPFQPIGRVHAGAPTVLLDGVAPAVGAGGWDSFRA